MISNLTGQYCPWWKAHDLLIARMRARSKHIPWFALATKATRTRHTEQLRYEHHNSDPDFLQDVYARYCDYCLRGAPVRLAWEVAFRDARNARSHAFQRRLRSMRLQVMQEFIKLDEGRKK